MITEVFTVDIIDEHSIPAFIDSNQLIIELESVDIYNNVIAPVHAKEYEIQPEIKVPYHIEIEQNTQKVLMKDILLGDWTLYLQLKFL